MKKIAALGAAGVAVLAARRYLAMRDALADVEPELRRPALPFVTVTHSAKTLPVPASALEELAAWRKVQHAMRVKAPVRLA